MLFRSLSFATLAALVTIAPPASAAGTAATTGGLVAVSKDAARNAAGRTVLVWDSGADVYARVFDATGAPVTDDLRLTETSRYDNQPDVVVLSDGRFVVLWLVAEDPNTDDQKLIARWYSSTGVAETDEVVVVSVNNAYPQVGGSMAVDADDEVAIAYFIESGATREAYLKRYDADGVVVGSTITDVDGQASGLSLSNIEVGRSGAGTMAVAFRSEGAIHARLLGADGTPSASSFQVSTTAGLALLNPHIAMAADGRFVVTWSEEADPYRYTIARGYGADGTAASGEVTVSPVFPETGFQVSDAENDVAIDSAGGYTVVFSRNDKNDDEASGDTTIRWDIWRRSFTRTGSALSAAVAVATDTSVHERSPVIALDASGVGMVFWEQGTSGSSHPIYGMTHASGTLTDLTLAMTAPTVRKHRGDKVKFGYTVGNSTPNAASGVTVAFTAPIQFRPLSALLGTTPCAVAGQTVTCTVGALAGNSSRTGSVTVKALKVGTFALLGSVSAGADSLETDLTDNSASVSKRIRK